MKMAQTFIFQSAIAACLTFLFTQPTNAKMLPRGTAYILTCGAETACNENRECMGVSYTASILELHFFDTKSGAFEARKMFSGPNLDGGLSGQFHTNELAKELSVKAVHHPAELLNSEKTRNTDYFWVFVEENSPDFGRLVYFGRPATEVPGMTGRKAVLKFECEQVLF